MTQDAPLTVTFVVPDLDTGGAERHVATLVRSLDRSRFAPRVLCIGREGGFFPEVATTAPARALGHSKRQAVRTVVDLVGEMRRTRPDVVVLRGYNAELLGRVAVGLARVPRCVVWVHNCDDLAPRGFVRRTSDRLLERATDRYFGVAERQTPYLVEELGHPRSKVRIVHNGVAPDLFDRPEHRAARPGLRTELGFGEDDVVVGILAALRPEKDHELFLRAARLVADAAPHARFLVVGGGERLLQLESCAAELGLTGRVVFTGTRADVPQLLQAIDVFVLCSYTIECFPMALLEAMASSRPAVCTSVGGVPEIVEHGVTGLLVPPKDDRALADALLELVRDQDVRAAMGRAGRARVLTHFTLDQSVQRAEEALLEVGDRGGPPEPIRLSVVMDETAVGGVEMVTLNMFRAFGAEAVRPRLVCLRTGGPLAADYRDAGFEVEALGRRSWRDLRTLPRLVRSLRRSRCDAVLIAHHHRASLVLGRVAAMLAGVRVTVVAAHDMDLVPLGQRCLPRSTVATLRWVSALVLLAPSQGAYLHRQEGVGRHWWSRTREVVIPNGIATGELPTDEQRVRARAGLGLPVDAYVVGVVARLAEQKAHHVLLEAIAQVHRTLPETWLVVVGGGQREAELKQLAHDLGISDRVVFTGIRRDVQDLLPAFDVSSLSSVHEAAPITVIESMAAGVPVVATDCGALRDLLVQDREGILVPVGDSKSLAEALLHLADDPARRRRMGAAARRRAVADFGVEVTARGYEALLASLVRGR